MRSGRSSMAFSMASAPSLAVWTVANGARPCRNISSTIGLSSTNKSLTFAGMDECFGDGKSAISTLLLFSLVIAGFPARLALQHDFPDLNSLVEGFAHVVDGQGGDAGGDQRFHFHSGSGRSRYF